MSEVVALHQIKCLSIFHIPKISGMIPITQQLNLSMIIDPSIYRRCWTTLSYNQPLPFPLKAVVLLSSRHTHTASTPRPISNVCYLHHESSYMPIRQIQEPLPPFFLSQHTHRNIPPSTKTHPSPRQTWRNPPLKEKGKQKNQV